MKRRTHIVWALAVVLLALSCRQETILPEPPPEPGKQQEEVPEEENVEKLLSGTALSSSAWMGLDLGEPYVITKVAYSPRTGQAENALLTVVEGANKADFSDALPLVMIRERSEAGQLTELPVNFSRGVRYVRCIGPKDVYSTLDELVYYGRKGAGDDHQLYQITNLPTVVINTVNGKAITSKETYISSNVYVVSNEGKTLLATTETGIRGRGNASWGFPKKPYKLRFAKKQSPLGAPAHDRKWTLINNYGDKTLMRNILAFEVSRRVGMAYTPFCQPVDVLLNGVYQGCYQLCDQVEAGVNRVPAKPGYLIEIDAYNYTEAVNFQSKWGSPITVHYPQEDSITTQQLAFIKQYFGKMEDAVFASSFRNPKTGYRRYLDLDSFLKNFIVGEFCGNTDTYWSVYMYKDAADGVLFTGPAWDYDLAFENDNRTYPINQRSDFLYARAGSVASEAIRSTVNRIVKEDPEARARLVELWDQTRPLLENLNEYVDSTAAVLDQSQQLNFKRWPILNVKVHQNPQAKGSYAAEVEVVKQYITGRLTRFDQLVRQ